MKIVTNVTIFALCPVPFALSHFPRTAYPVPKIICLHLPPPVFLVTCPYGLIAINMRRGTADSLYFVDSDHLGSILALMRNNGTTAAAYSYDEWGRRRNPSDWNDYINIPNPGFIDRGYTGHEHYDQFNLIDMLSEEGILSDGAKSREPYEAGNGRVYDPVIGHFLSPDPVIQAPDFTQNYNSYSYCLNNPLKYVDPSGYSASSKNSLIDYWNALALGYSGDYTDFTAFVFQQDIETHNGYLSGGGSRTSTNGYTITWDEKQYYFNGEREEIRDENGNLIGITLPEIGIYVTTYSITIGDNYSKYIFKVGSETSDGFSLVNNLVKFDANINFINDLKYAQKVNGVIIPAKTLNAIKNAKASQTILATDIFEKDLGYLNFAFILGDMYANRRIMPSNVVNALMTGAAVSEYGAPVALVWFLADIGFEAFSNKSLSSRFDSYIGPLVTF
jgi:hypothetical protein